ncbi:hypothetical protein Poli38472_014454 [Pythium oligandrum]|uniref:Uncharacterized protein n=1 Tax=Pythium oligandrum TaxID=41045 RepID=A0A8K1CDH4_PYTOL|nr:hypothetical protein Poli38472_014454 [Pythium oligandrum]|eukprot:TMW60993.1 hypothetical protein Poli38472_014454 [Pythium oligandrum]
MSQKQSPSRMIILLPMMFLMNKIDFENPVILNSARAAYILCQALSLFLYLYIKRKIELKNDTRKIRIPGVTSPFDQTPNYDELTETTYRDHELAKVNEFIKQTLIGAGISSFIHFKMGVNHVVMIQSVMTPLNLYDNVLIQAYILGKRDGRIWNEKLEGEAIDAPVDGSATDAKKAKKQSGLPAVTPSEAIAQAVAAGSDADFDELWEVVKKNVNATTTDDKWTALMAACGSPVDTDDFIRNVIKAGADVTATDGDGWTALHWSAYHGRPEAAEALLENTPKKKLAALLAIKATDGRTALEVAEGEENSDVVEVIQKFSGSGASKKDESESELRRRKPAANATSTTSVDEVD